MAINFRFVKDAFGHINGTSFVEQTEQALNEVAKLPQDVLDLANAKIEQIDIRVGQAQAAATAAESSASASSSSATTSQKWAEGSDADVQPLGGTHSAKGWVQSIGPYLIDVQTVADNMTAVTTVYTNISSVNTVATNISAINTANANAANINAVATNIANVNSVADNSTNINTVATSIADVSAVATIDDAVSSVANNSAAIIAVNNNKTNINAVNSNKTNIDTVATNATAINNVSTNLSSITTANANATNITTVATNIADVNTVAGMSSTITAVANNSSNINAVNANSGNINSVAGNATNINAAVANASNINVVATNIANVNAVATDLPNIDAASGYAATAKQYAIGDPSEPSSGHSAKWYSEHMAVQYVGEYDATATYAKNDFVKSVVSSTSYFYVSLLDNNIGHALTDTSWWTPFFSIDGNGVFGMDTDIYTIETESATGQSFTLEGFVQVLVYIDGALATNNVNYTISGSTVTFVSPLPVDTQVKFIRFTGAAGLLPIAGASTLGGVKVGSGLSVTDEGVLSTSQSYVMSTNAEIDAIPV